MRKTIIRYFKKSGYFIFIGLCFSILTGCKYLMDMNKEADQGVSNTTSEFGEKLISIPITLSGAFSSKHTVQISMKDLTEAGKS